VTFDGGAVTYGLGELDVLAPAYAATVHKSQGSEYPAVIIPVLTQHYPMLQRNLPYKGVTRGKRLVVLVGQKRAVAIAVRNASSPAALVEARRVASPRSFARTVERSGGRRSMTRPGFLGRPDIRRYVTLGGTAGSAVGARDFSSAGGAPLPARFSSATRASARTLGSLSLSSVRSSGTTDSIPGCLGPRRPRCHAARLRTKEISSCVPATKAGMASGFSG
jgi:hypothetical protein